MQDRVICVVFARFSVILQDMREKQQKIGGKILNNARQQAAVLDGVGHVFYKVQMCTFRQSASEVLGKVL